MWVMFIGRYAWAYAFMQVHKYVFYRHAFRSVNFEICM